MFRHLPTAIGAWLICVCPARSAEFPYTAYVNSDDVYIRSGPGKDYYPTDKLRRGEQVEVYRHDPGGWYAIRPPRRSFSWVLSRSVEPAAKGLSKVTGDRVVARVGSAFSDVREVIQVRLDRGEDVEILDTLQTSQGLWCKIEPPSGEFRWISGKFLDQVEPAATPAKDRDGSASTKRNEDEDSDSAAEAAQARTVSATSQEDQSAPGESARRKPNQPAADAEENLDGQNSAATSAPELGNPNRATARTRSGKILTGDRLQKELDAIDLELSIMVAEEISVWSFDELHRRCEAALDGAQTAVERGRVRVVLNKLARFEDLKRRHDEVLTTQADTDRRNRQLGDTKPPRPDNMSRFDGVGRLTSVASRKVGAPQFALVNAAGAVIYYVTPAPGVNLRSYLDKQVGVNGQRGFVTELQKEQINVQRVTQLETARRFR